MTALDTDTAITIPSGASVTIDLNGHTLDRGLTSLVKDGESAFWVPSGASLTITDSSEAHSGVITGGYGYYGGGIENYGTVNLYGGTVTGNSAVYGGGIYSDGELHIKGHIIVENNQDFDIYLTADKRLILDGTLDLREGNQPFIGVYSEGDPHNFTSNYSTYISDTWPDEVFFGNAATVAHTYDSGEAWYSDYQIAYLDRTWNSEKNEVEEQLKSVSGCTILNNQPDINNLNLYGWYAVTSSDTFSHPINITGDCNLILCDGVKLTCNKGILVSEGVTLNIYGQKLGTGELYAETPSDNSAAIGGGAGDFGVINFRGGKIEAKARYNISRGIGFRTSDGGASVNFYGGEVKAYPNPAQGTLQGYSISGVLATNVAIYGGDLDITAGTDNPGIGAKGTIRICGGHVKAKGSYQVDSSGNETNKYSGAGIDGTVEISGGVVEAYGTANGAGIGGSFANNNITYAGNITITGGTVTAVGGIYGAGIGGNGITYPNPLREQIITITGGTVTATGGSQGGAGIGGNSYQDVSNSRRYTGGSTVIITG